MKSPRFESIGREVSSVHRIRLEASTRLTSRWCQLNQYRRSNRCLNRSLELDEDASQPPQFNWMVLIDRERFFSTSLERMLRHLTVPQSQGACTRSDEHFPILDTSQCDEQTREMAQRTKSDLESLCHQGRPKLLRSDCLYGLAPAQHMGLRGNHLHQANPSSWPRTPPARR
jgi:hypothetical protein